MIKKCCGNDMTAFAKLSHVTCVRTATDGNMSVVALNLEKGFLVVATYGVNICRFVKSDGLKQVMASI